MTCDGCHRNKPTTGAIVNNKFGRYCKDCIYSQSRQTNARNAQYSRDRDREAHERDLLQPWNANGTPNKDFIREYPEEARDNFSQEELERFA